MAEARVVFQNANLIDGSGPPQPGASVVIEGKRIVHAGAGRRRRDPAIARSISPARP